jgi:hypothetical protein
MTDSRPEGAKEAPEARRCHEAGAFGPEIVAPPR